MTCGSLLKSIVHISEYLKVHAMKSGTLPLFILGLVISLFSGCGKHETTNGAVGAVAGGALGNLVTGGKSKGFGTLMGAALGGIIGSEVGRNADEEIAEERADRRMTEIQLSREKNKHKKVIVVQTTPRMQGTWCSQCSRSVSIEQAKRCPDCGDMLVCEKFCDYCHESFGASSAYRYCPYCPQRSRLVWR